MDTFLLVVHSILRWAVVIAAVAAVGSALWGVLRKREYTALDDRLGLIFTITMDVQILVGLILYFVSPLVRGAFADFGSAMSSQGLRFFAVEHSFLMIVALVLAHVGRVLVKRVDTAQGKHRRGLILFGLATVVLLAAIPWPFLEYGRPLIRFS